MQRRQFLSTLALGGTGLSAFGQWAVAAVPDTSRPSPDTERKLVVVFMRGAVDGLNVVVPYAEPDYYRVRTSIAIPKPGQEDGAIDLDGRFGLNPALAPLMPYWQRKKLAFVHASGSPDGTRSHFDAQDYMESGTPGQKNTSDGWMNRLLGVLPTDSARRDLAIRAVSIGAVLPRIYAGRMSVANIAAGAAGERPTVLDRPLVNAAFTRLYQGDDKMSRAFQDSQAAHREVMASMSMDPIATEKEMKAANNGAPLPNGFPDDARRLAVLMRRNARVQLAFMAVGGWDTHANEGGSKGQLSNRLKPLGQGLAALADGLGPVFDKTTIVVISEFGRTVAQNGNGGTDHGHGNVMWLLGGPVAGAKVHGPWPGLENGALYQGRDLAITTDFRTVFAQIAERHLLLPDARLSDVFPQMPRNAPSLDLIRRV